MPRPKGSKNKKTLAAAKTTAPSPASIQEQIDITIEDIETLTTDLKNKKAQLKKLQKAFTVAKKAAEVMKAEEQKAAILKAVAASGKSVDEILAMLK